MGEEILELLTVDLEIMGSEIVGLVLAVILLCASGQVGRMTAMEFESLEHRGIPRCLRTGVSGPEMSGPIF